MKVPGVDAPGTFVAPDLLDARGQVLDITMESRSRNPPAEAEAGCARSIA